MDPQNFSLKIDELLRRNMIDEATQIISDVEFLLKSGSTEISRLRIDRAIASIEQIKIYKQKIFTLIDDDPGCESILLNPVDLNNSAPLKVNSINDVLSGGYGVYEIKNEPVDSGYYESYVPEEIKKISSEVAVFARKIKRVVNDIIWVQGGVRFTHPNLAARTVFDANANYIPSRSNHLSRRVGLHASMLPNGYIPVAFILPIPYSATNYYHALSEMISGLRYVQYLDHSVPIIHDVDSFKLLPLYAKILSIDLRRFVPLNSVSEMTCELAILPDSPPFYWDANFITFFDKVKRHLLNISSYGATAPIEKVYVSRSKSARKLPLEKILEDRLIQSGFSVIYAEELNHIEQVILFSRLEVIVAPHGAGLTNIVFCSPGVRLIEIFVENYVVSDFYHRSKHLKIYYDCVIADEFGLYIQKVLDRLN